MTRQLLPVCWILITAFVFFPNLMLNAASTTECGGNFTESSGLITNANLKFQYRCEWRITVKESHIIKLRSDELRRCCGVIYVYDGSCRKSNRLASGSFPRLSLPPVRSTTNNMCISFYSYSGVPLYNATYTSELCLPFTYGKESCDKTCPCVQANSVSCNNRNGSCICKKGWKGENCSVDRCQNGKPCPKYSVCVNTSGSFKCRGWPCYVGSSNDECSECVEGTYGESCSHICQCYARTTSYCNKTDGTCVCKEGWFGSDCQNRLMFLIISVVIGILLLGALIIFPLIIFIKRKKSAKSEETYYESFEILESSQTAQVTKTNVSHQSFTNKEFEDDTTVYSLAENNPAEAVESATSTRRMHNYPKVLPGAGSTRVPKPAPKPPKQSKRNQATEHWETYVNAVPPRNDSRHASSGDDGNMYEIPTTALKPIASSNYEIMRKRSK